MPTVRMPVTARICGESGELRSFVVRIDMSGVCNPTDLRDAIWRARPNLEHVKINSWHQEVVMRFAKECMDRKLIVDGSNRNE
jgi:hypothetical protein